MKKYNLMYSFLTIIIVAWCIGCNPVNQPENSDAKSEDLFTSLLNMNTNVDGSILVQACTFASSFSTPDYSIMGQCYVNGIQVPAGDMIASNAILSLNQFSTVRDYGYDMGFCTNSQYYPTYGDTTTWGVTGSSDVTGFSDDMYVKPEIQILSPYQDVDTIYKRNDGFNIQWNGTNSANKVIMYIECYKMGTAMYFGYIPTTDYYWLNENISDVGSYVIPDSVFSNLPDSCAITIKIGRYDSKILDVNSKNYAFTALSYTIGSYPIIP